METEVAVITSVQSVMSKCIIKKSTNRELEVSKYWEFGDHMACLQLLALLEISHDGCFTVFIRLFLTS